MKCERNNISGRYLVQLYSILQEGIISSYIQFTCSNSSKKMSCASVKIIIAVENELSNLCKKYISVVKEVNLCSAFFEKYSNIKKTKSSLSSLFIISHFVIHENIKP